MNADRRSLTGWIAVWTACLSLALPAGGSAANVATDTSATDASATDMSAPDAKAILQRAFANQYDVNIKANIELRMTNNSGKERTRRFEALQKIIGDRHHAIGRLTHPEYLRGMTILQIESEETGHEAFIYMPSLRKVRRISMLQRGDSLFGTDVTYEDLERRHVSDYTIAGLNEGSLREPVFIIETRPTRAINNERVVFYIAQSDDVILEIRYYKNDSPDPFRSVSVTRTGMIEADGHHLATRLTVRNLSRGTTTEVTFSDMTINPPIDDRVFSLRTLEQERDLFRSFR